MDWKQVTKGTWGHRPKKAPTFLAVKQHLFISYLWMRGMLVKNMGCLEANNDSPIIEHREGLLILRAGEIAQEGLSNSPACYSRACYLHDQGTAGLSRFCQKPPPNNKTPKPNKQTKRKKETSKLKKKPPLKKISDSNSKSTNKLCFTSKRCQTWQGLSALPKKTQVCSTFLNLPPWAAVPLERQTGSFPSLVQTQGQKEIGGHLLCPREGSSKHLALKTYLVQRQE